MVTSHQPPNAIVAQGRERVPPRNKCVILPMGMLRIAAEAMRYTWLIWGALRRRPRHPLYQYSLRLAPLSATPLLLALATVIGGAALLLPDLFSTLILTLIGGIYLLGVYQGTVAGAALGTAHRRAGQPRPRRRSLRALCGNAGGRDERGLGAGDGLLAP